LNEIGADHEKPKPRRDAPGLLFLREDIDAEPNGMAFVDWNNSNG
jgi:hypothetical protein